MMTKRSMAATTPKIIAIRSLLDAISRDPVSFTTLAGNATVTTAIVSRWGVPLSFTLMTTMYSSLTQSPSLPVSETIPSCDTAKRLKLDKRLLKCYNGYTQNSMFFYRYKIQTHPSRIASRLESFLKSWIGARMYSRQLKTVW